jgi:uncharacterized protein (DUF2141 family)
MKTLRRLAVSTAVIMFAAPALAETVTVKLLGVEPRGGKVQVGVYTQEDFQKKPTYSTLADAPAKKGDITVTIQNVPPGTYAMSSMHDENGDFKMQQHPSGMPKEGWATINGDFLRGAPTFDDAKFTVVASRPVTITEMMHYSGR